MNASASYNHHVVSQANRRYYDAVAEKYREYEAYAYTGAIVQDVLGLLTAAANRLSKREHFLDFGCGSGFLSRLVCDHRLFQSATGVDISEHQIKLYHRAIQAQGFRALLGDALQLPFKAAVFDMAASYSVLHHFFDYKAVLMEITRVLKPGGILYADFEPNRTFQTLLAPAIAMRRRFFDKAPQQLDELERVAEYHNNIKKGIHKKELLSWLAGSYTILDTGARFPMFRGDWLLKGAVTLIPPPGPLLLCGGGKKMKDNLFICSINHQYIPRILQAIPVPVKILGRLGFDYTLLDPYPGNKGVIEYSKPNYRFFHMLRQIKHGRFFQDIYVPCYDVYAVQPAFLSLEWYCFFFAKRTIFVDIKGKQKILTPSRVLDQIAWHRFIKHLKITIY